MEKIILEQIINDGENEGIEFKESLSADVKKDLPTLIASFANTNGGKILIGISDDKKLLGYEGDYQKDVEYITQVAKSCKPLIKPTIYQEAYLGKVVLVVEINKSSVLHSDKNYRFPCRLNTITDYLDFHGIISSLKERGIGHLKPSEKQEDKKREEITKEEFDFYSGNLKKTRKEAKVEILKDLNFIIYQKSIPNFEPLINIITELLVDNASEIRMQAIQTLQSFLRMEKDSIPVILNKSLENILQIAKIDSDFTVRTYAFQFLADSNNEKAMNILIEELLNLSESDFNRLNYLSFFSGWHYEKSSKIKIKSRLIEELEKDHNPEIKKRIEKALENLKQGGY